MAQGEPLGISKELPKALAWGIGDLKGLADVTLFCHLSHGSSFDLALRRLQQRHKNQVW